MRPIWSDLEHTRDATRLWQRSQRRFTGNVLGPHFEQVARHWTRHTAPPERFGDYPNLVGTGTVNDPASRTTHELDVIAFGLDDDDRHRLLGIGEAKWGELPIHFTARPATPSRLGCTSRQVRPLSARSLAVKWIANWGETMGLPHLDRLRHIRDLLTTQGRHGAAHARLACYSGKGFTDDLRRAADHDDTIVLVTIDDLYHER